MERNRRIFGRITLVLYVITSVILAWNLVYGASNVTSINLALLLLTNTTFIPLLIKIRSKDKFEIYEPIYGYIYIFFIIYLFSSVIAYNTSIIDFSRKTLNIYDSRQMCSIIISLSVSILLFHLGYYLNSITGKRKIKIEKSIKNDIFNYNNIILPLYFISIAFRIYGYSSGKLGSLVAISDSSINIPFATVFFFISNIWFVYFAYYSACHFLYKKYSTIFYFAILFETIIVLVSGDRRYIIEVFLIAFAFYYERNKYISWKKIGILFSIFVFIVWPIVTLYGFMLETTNNFDSAFGQFGSVIDILQTLSFSDIFDNYILSSIVNSMFFLPDCQTAYVFFDEAGVNWGPVGLLNLLNNLVPSSFISRIDVRQYYDIFAVYSLGRSVDYSWLTFMATSEAIICYGLYFMPVAFFIRGIVSSSIYKKLYYEGSFSKVFYYSLFFSLIYSFHCGLLTSELVTPLRVYIYYRIIALFVGARKS